jgi:hypothetical protein
VYPRLVSAKWLKNHGVMLRYAGNGSGRFVPPQGELTTGQAARLLDVLPMQIYRLEARKLLRFRRRGGVAMIPLSDLRKLNHR